MAARSTSSPTRRELARGTIELAILAALAEERRYGYELMSVLDEASEGAIEVKEGTLYPVLHRLEDAGWVSTSWTADGRASPRKYYELTRQGRRRLDALKGEWEQLVCGMRRLLGEGDAG